MSILPEAILQRAIINGLRQTRKDSRILDAIFKNTHQDQLHQIKKFLLETSIDFSINYPKKDLVLPTIVLLLKNESESQQFLGDVLGDVSDPFVPDPELSVDTLGGHYASVSDSRGLPRLLLGGIKVHQQTSSSTVSFQSDETECVSELLENPVGALKLYVVSGSGKGQVFDVLRIRNDSLDIDGTFEVQLDSSSVIDLRVPDDPEMAVGEPSRVYEKTPSLRRKGANYRVTYYLHILAAHQDQVMYLYHMTKALLFSQRTFLEAQGVQALEIGGSDLAPRTDYLPTEAFQRMMTLSFNYPFSFLEEQEVFDVVNIEIVPEPADDVESVLISSGPIKI